MKRLSLLLALLVLSSSPSFAQEKFDPAARLATVAPFVDEQTIAIGRADVERIDVPEFMKLVLSLAPPAEQPERVKEDIAQAQLKAEALRQAFLNAGGRELYTVVSLADIPASPPFVVVPLKNKDKAKVIAHLANETFQLKDFHEFEGGLVFGSAETLARLKTLKPTARPDFAKAFAAAGDTTAQLVFSPSDDNRRVLREMLPRLPEDLGGASGATIAAGLQWAAIGVNAPPKISVTGTVQSKDAESAAALRTLIQSSLKMLGSQEQVRERLPNFGEIAKLITPGIKGDQLTLAINEDNGKTQQVLQELVVPALQAAQGAAGRNRSMNNLKHFGLAMHNHHNMYKRLPARATRSKDGKPLLSWRVQILPLIDQMPLYQQFHLDEPWDSEHNRKLVEKMPELFAAPQLAREQVAKGLTTYVVPFSAPPAAAAKDGAPAAKRERMIFDDPAGTKIQSIVDGTSNTIMIVEAHPKHAVIWTRPDDLEIDLTDPLAGLKGQSEKGFNAVIADGSVRFILDSIDPKTLRLLLLMNDLQPVPQY